MRGNRPLSSGGWSTAGRAGRKKTPVGTRPQRNIRATDEEWNVIKKFAAIAKSDLPQAKKILGGENMTTWAIGYFAENGEAVLNGDRFTTETSDRYQAEEELKRCYGDD